MDWQYWMGLIGYLQLMFNGWALTRTNDELSGSRTIDRERRLQTVAQRNWAGRKRQKEQGRQAKEKGSWADRELLLRGVAARLEGLTSDAAMELYPIARRLFSDYLIAFDGPGRGGWATKP